MFINRILVTGANGQIGSELVPKLELLYGKENVISVSKSDFDIQDTSKILELIKKHQINTIYHLASLLSATSESDPNQAWQVNLISLKNILELAVDYKLKVFWPSSIAVFGNTSPKHAPQHTVLEPTTMYGVTKVSGELLCQYYHHKYAVDVRSLRYPGVVSWKTHPGGGTTDYIVAMFHAAINKQTYYCYLNEDTSLPMIYIDDVINATLKLMETPANKLTVHTSYNLSGFSVTPKEVVKSINKTHPLEVIYDPDYRQAIADSWPDSIDGSASLQDWGWESEYDLESVTQVMFDHLPRP